MRKQLIRTFLLLSLSSIAVNALAAQSAWDKTKSGIHQTSSQAWGNIKSGAKDTLRATQKASKKVVKGGEEASKGLWQSIKDAFK